MVHNVVVVQEQAHGLPHYTKEKPEHHIAHLHKHLCKFVKNLHEFNLVSNMPLLH